MATCLKVWTAKSEFRASSIEDFWMEEQLAALTIHNARASGKRVLERMHNLQNGKIKIISITDEQPG
jgi:hypothetical protein